ncbi:MAG TPA: hypothetical protein VF720_15705 [Candidatus Eisenbacteria bacterium]
MNGRRGAMSTVILSLVILATLALVTACQRATPPAGKPAPVSEVALARSPDAAPRFVSGGTDRIVGLLCGATLHRFVAGNEALSPSSAPAVDIRAAWFGPDPIIDRWLVRTNDGIAVTTRDLAVPMPEWPAGADVGPAVFASGGATLAAAPAGGDDRRVRVCNFEPSKVQPGFVADNPLILPVAEGATVLFVDLDLTGKYILTVDDQGHIGVYQAPGTKPVYTQTLDPETEGTIRAADLSPEGDWFVVSARSVKVRAWRLPFMSAPLTSFGDVTQVFFAGGVESLITVDENGLAIRWLLNYGKVKAEATAQLDSLTTAVTADASGRLLMSLTPDGRVRAWPTATLAELEALTQRVCVR